MRVAAVRGAAPRPVAVCSGRGAAVVALAMLLLATAATCARSAAGTVPMLAEDATFWQQPERVLEAVRGIAPGTVDRANVYFLGFAGDDSQEIFTREVRYASAVVASRVDPPGRNLLLLNNRAANDAGSPIASIGTLRLALEVLTGRMDVDRDILFLYLTSHGLPSHDLYVANGDLPLEQISPGRLRAVLDSFGFRRKIIVVSACFSGEFARILADDSSVVLTASRADRPSFGCRDSRRMTYFGEALWQYAMQRAASVEQAFGLARSRVAEMERDSGLTPSEPQLLVGGDAGQWFAGMILRPATDENGLLATGRDPLLAVR